VERTEPAGRQAGTITIPTLVADGTLDQLDPTANTRILATHIKHSTLRLYPDAGHAFLFQDEATFFSAIASFLGPQPQRR